MFQELEMSELASQPVPVFAVRPRFVSRQNMQPGGFSLLEVMVSIGILAVGLMAAALLMTNTYKYSVRSRYVAEAAQLASEKLEDLNRYPVTNSAGVLNPDPHIFIPLGSNTCGMSGVSCVGSITPALTCTKPGVCVQNAAATPLTITVGQAGAGGTQSNTAATVSYNDAVFMSAANGTLQETYQTMVGGTLEYETLTFSPNGRTPTTSDSATAPTAGETFDRRWIIEQDQPVAGVRRVTVLVTLMDATIQPPVTFQMSMVRP
jgi:prepilin-type N-terminal cleavage/methylation domain-containing protein